MLALRDEALEVRPGVRNCIGQRYPDSVEAMPARRIAQRSVEVAPVQKSRSA
jgi:hypothetical protein